MSEFLRTVFEPQHTTDSEETEGDSNQIRGHQWPVECLDIQPSTGGRAAVLHKPSSSAPFLQQSRWPLPCVARTPRASLSLGLGVEVV
eukprot:4925831-Amphidinium_carterae.1